MSKLVVAEYVSLDGVMEEPAWTGPYFDEDLGKLQQDLLFASDALAANSKSFAKEEKR